MLLIALAVLGGLAVIAIVVLLLVHEHRQEQRLRDKDLIN